MQLPINIYSCSSLLIFIIFDFPFLKIHELFQMMLMVGTILGPGTIFLMMIGAMNAITGMSMGNALLLNLIPVVIFITVCMTCKSEIQVPTAD